MILKRGTKSFLYRISFLFLVSSFVSMSLGCASSSSPVIISELESNPPGSDAGAEWVELYSTGKVSLDGWKLKNSGDKTLDLSSFGNIDGILVVNFEKQFLNNKDERVYLYDSSNKKIDESDVFSDPKNNGMTWQICDSGWTFKESTKGEDNACGGKVDRGSDESVNNKNSLAEGITDVTKNVSEKDVENVGMNSPKEPETPETKTIINLNSQESVKQTGPLTGKVIYRSTNEMMREYAIYVFAFFLIVIIAVLLIKKG